LSHKNQRGFSLLETLIASTIFATVLLLASSAFKFFMSIGERPVNSQSVMQESMASITLRGAIKGLYHYYIKQNAVTNAPAKLLFLGTKNGFTGISVSALDFPQQPARITLSEKKDNAGILNLAYCEYDNNVIYPTVNIKTECDSPKTIATNIKKFHFSYFGWSSISHLYNNPYTSNNLIKNKEWSVNWDASIRGILPQFIKIEIEYNEKQATFQPTQLWFHITDADPVQFSTNGNSNE
jgi:prepilin-type N-terminal cleavage/methylation domain-containing protein